MTFTPRPPVEKLPLSIRKDLRDNFDAKKESFEKDISDLLGRPYTININPNAIYAYAGEGYAKERTGKVLADYFDSFVSGLRSLIDKYPEDGKNYFNEAVTASEITMTVDESNKYTTVGGDIKDGVYRILFGAGYLASNIGETGQKIPAAINDAPRTADLPFFVSASIKKDYESKIAPIKEAISEQSGFSLDELVLDPNFLECYKKLTEKSASFYDQQFGAVAFEYYKGLQYQMDRLKFKGDDLMQEGLAEAVHKKTFKIRVVEKLEKGSCNETVIEDGVAYLQTLPNYWYSNTSEMGSDLLRVLDG